MQRTYIGTLHIQRLLPSRCYFLGKYLFFFTHRGYLATWLLHTRPLFSPFLFRLEPQSTRLLGACLFEAKLRYFRFASLRTLPTYSRSPQKKPPLQSPKSLKLVNTCNVESRHCPSHSFPPALSSPPMSVALVFQRIVSVRSSLPASSTLPSYSTSRLLPSTHF